jgi:hypothetical protein
MIILRRDPELANIRAYNAEAAAESKHSARIKSLEKRALAAEKAAKQATNALHLAHETHAIELEDAHTNAVETARAHFETLQLSEWALEVDRVHSTRSAFEDWGRKLSPALSDVAISRNTLQIASWQLQGSLHKSAAVEKRHKDAAARFPEQQGDISLLRKDLSRWRSQLTLREEAIEQQEALTQTAESAAEKVASDLIGRFNTLMQSLQTAMTRLHEAAKDHTAAEFFEEFQRQLKPFLANQLALHKKELENIRSVRLAATILSDSVKDVGTALHSIRKSRAQACEDGAIVKGKVKSLTEAFEKINVAPSLPSASLGKGKRRADSEPDSTPAKVMVVERSPMRQILDEEFDEEPESANPPPTPTPATPTLSSLDWMSSLTELPSQWDDAECQRFRREVLSPLVQDLSLEKTKAAMDKRAFGTDSSRHGMKSCFVFVDVKRRKTGLPVNDHYDLRANCQYHARSPYEFCVYADFVPGTNHHTAMPTDGGKWWRIHDRSRAALSVPPAFPRRR